MIKCTFISRGKYLVNQCKYILCNKKKYTRLIVIEKCPRNWKKNEQICQKPPFNLLWAWAKSLTPPRFAEVNGHLFVCYGCRFWFFLRYLYWVLEMEKSVVLFLFSILFLIWQTYLLSTLFIQMRIKTKNIKQPVKTKTKTQTKTNIFSILSGRQTML
jgi:hypothetical protein